MDDLSGRMLGDYRVLRRLGAGAMGEVYLARQLSLNRDVALKILRDELASSPTALRRFQAEAEAVARLSHANVVQVYAVGECDGLRFMALEYVEGRNLREYLARKGPPEWPVAVAILKQVAAALQRAAELGLVHRDIKPDNILVTKQAEVKVADFGLSRVVAGDGPAPVHLTQSGTTVGTPLYMSPEQVQGIPVDHRSDLYSLGVTAYHLLSGQVPFTGETAFEVAVQHVQNEPPPLLGLAPHLPADLARVVHKLLMKLPADRYATARELALDLARVEGGEALSERGWEGFAGRASASLLPAPSARRAGRPALVALLLLASAGVGWGAARLARSPRPAAPEASADALPAGLVAPQRERQLRSLLGSRSAKPPERLAAGIELGLRLLRERRLDEADAAFRDLDPRTDRLIAKGIVPAALAAKLGQAAVLAYRDAGPDSKAPQESLDLFEQAVGSKVAAQAVSRLLHDRPELAEAVSEALARDAENLRLPKLPDRLAWLRTPGGVLRGPLGGG